MIISKKALIIVNIARIPKLLDLMTNGIKFSKAEKPSNSEADTEQYEEYK